MGSGELMKIIINFKGTEELEEFYSTNVPEIIKKKEIPMLYVTCDGIETEWYVPLSNILWYEINYEESELSGNTG